MRKIAYQEPMLWQWLPLIAAGCMTLACLVPLKFANAAEAMADQYQLEKVVMLLRHGVRSGFNPERDALYSGKPWPDFGYPDGQLTGHGRDALVIWGAYHRTLLNQAGLFAVDQALSAADVLVETSPKKRTRESAEAFLSGLSPGFVVPLSSPDASRWFLPYTFGQAIPDPAKGRAAAMNVLGMTLSAAQAHYRPTLLSIERALSIKEGRLADQPWRVEVKRAIRFEPLCFVEDMLETVRMQYANGMPIEDVAFGSVPDAQALTALMGIRTLYWQMVHLPRDIALPLYAPLFAAMSHALLDGASVAGNLRGTTKLPITSSGAKLAVFVGHDSNIAPISAILGFQWKMPGGLENDQQPGGFIMFERLREIKSSARFIRVSYHAQTLDQLRHLSALSISPSDPASPVSPVSPVSPAATSAAALHLDPLHMAPLTVPFREDFKAPATWSTHVDHLIPIAQYEAMVQNVAAEAEAAARP